MAQSGFSADLTSFDLLDLVQVISMDRRDLSLKLRAGSQTRGMLRFAQGELLWAEFEGMRGEAAFMALAAQQTGSVEQLAWGGNSERNVYQPISRLIMQAVEYRERQTRPEAEPGTVSEKKRPLSAEEVAALPTGAMPATLLPGPRGGRATPPGPLPVVPPAQDQLAPQLAQPAMPPSLMNGKLNLPVLTNGARPSAPSTQPVSADPPTVPLPLVPGGLLDIAQKRETPASEPKRSSLSILEQMAAGAWDTAGKGSAGAPGGNDATISNGSVPKGHDLSALYTEPPPLQQKAVRLLEPAGAEPERQVMPLEVAVPESAGPDPSAAEGVRLLRQALELFAGQVGIALLATAVIRTDGSVMAQHAAGGQSEQDFISPAYHMAHVMQASLRTLLMGGWGDLEDTLITGSTHVVVVRRLGRAEKGLFHIAVLKRSGNPGLCRVMMRNNEPTLLRLV